MEDFEIFPVLSDNVQLSDMTPWQGTLKFDKELKFSAALGDPLTVSDGKVHFQFDEDLNSKIYLWNGDVTQLAVQAVVLPIYEAMSRSSPLHVKLTFSAGAQLVDDCRKVTNLCTGEVNLLHGYNLAARHAVLSVEPKYNPKYHSAADTALHTCYRAALQFCAEKEFKTIAITPLHITRKGFPISDGCVIALRTIRKSLEILNAKFQAVVIVTDPSVAEEYSKIFPLYFPRSILETEGQRLHLPSDSNLDRWGAIFKEERSIRIPDITEMTAKDKDEPCPLPRSNSQGQNGIDPKSVVDQRMAPRTFPRMSINHDKNRRLMLHYSMTQQTLESQERVYLRLLRVAKSDNFSNFSALHGVKIMGYDVAGNRVIVVVGRQLVFHQIDPEKFLLYLIKTFDPVVGEPYTIVYFHTNTSDFNRPSKDYLRKIYSTVDQRYRSNLARLCIVHLTSTFAKLRIWMFLVTSASEIRDRVVYVRSVPELYKIVMPNQIDIPPFILNYDMKNNPEDYIQSRDSNHRRPKSELNRVPDATL